MNSSILKTLLQKPKTYIILWLLIALVCALLKYSIGPDQYNNYIIFESVAKHLFNQQQLYIEYPSEYVDHNYYGPIFGVLIAPIAWLPRVVGISIWLVGMTAALAWAINSLKISDKAKCVVFILSANDLICAAMMQQFNIGIAAILIGSYALIERNKEWAAAALIVLGTFTKLYGVMGLAMFFVVKRKWRFIGYGVLWSAVALLLPLLFVDANYLFSQYKEWFEALTGKNSMNDFGHFVNISILGVIRNITGNPNYSDLWMIVPAVLLFLGANLRRKCFNDENFKLLLLAFSLIFVVIFSTGSENSGYIIAGVGAAIWWVTLEKKSAIEYTILVLVLIASFARNLFPIDFYYTYIMQYSLRAIPMAIVWLHITYQLYFRKFQSKTLN